MTSPRTCPWLKVAKAASKSRSVLAFADVQLQPESAGHRLQVFRLNLGDRVGRVEEQADGGRRRQQLVYQFQPLLSGIHVQRHTPVTLPPGRFAGIDEQSMPVIDAAEANTSPT